MILFSSLINEEMRRKGEQVGADAQLSKPEIANLVGLIDRLSLNIPGRAPGADAGAED